MKYLFIGLFAAVCVSPMSGEEVYTVREVGGKVMLLNTQTGTSYWLDEDGAGPRWKRIEMESPHTGEGDFQGMLRPVDMTVPNQALSHGPGLSDETALATIELVNTSKQPRRYMVEAKLPDDAKVQTICSFHRTIDGARRGWSYPEPESEFVDATARFGVEAKPLEAIELQIIFQTKAPTVQVEWTVHDDVGGADSLMSTATGARSLYPITPQSE